MSDSLQPHRLYSPWNSPGQNTGVGNPSRLQGILPTQGSNLSPTLQADSLPTKSHGKPKNTGVGSLSLLQRIFLIQESNQGLLHCRRTLYQLNHQGSPFLLFFFKFYFILLYNTVLVLPYINMNLPQVYMCSQS